MPGYKKAVVHGNKGKLASEINVVLINKIDNFLSLIEVFIVQS